jgi:hypothetical protein
MSHAQPKVESRNKASKASVAVSAAGHPEPTYQQKNMPW